LVKNKKIVNGLQTNFLLGLAGSTGSTLQASQVFNYPYFFTNLIRFQLQINWVSSRPAESDQILKLWFSAITRKQLASYIIKSFVYGSNLVSMIAHEDHVWSQIGITEGWQYPKLWYNGQCDQNLRLRGPYA
jgi:hypothetical protein